MKKLTTIILLLLAVVVTGISATVYAKQHMNWYQKGEKTYGSSYITTYFDSTLSAETFWYGGSNHKWDGTSRSRWFGSTPNNADTVTHVDTIWVDSLGSVSFGYPSGVTVGLTSNSASLSYTDSNTYYVRVDYTYTAGAFLPVYQGQKSSGTFKFGSNFVVVDSEGNNTYEYKSAIWYT